MAATPSPLPLVGSPPPDRSAWQLAAAPTRAAIIWCHVVTGAVHQEPVVLPPGSPLAIGGWAVDDAAGGPAAGVTIAIDGVPLLDAEYGGETPGWFAPQPYPASGFRAIVPAADLTPGRHTVTIRVLARDGRHYYAPSQRVLLDVR